MCRLISPFVAAGGKCSLVYTNKNQCRVGIAKRELILVLFVRLFDLSLFGFAYSLFLLVSWKRCGL